MFPAFWQVPAQATEPAPVRVIYDTDMATDIDDAMALAMLHALEDRGEAELLAVTISTEDPWAAAYVDLVDTYYHRGGIPIGMVRNGRSFEGSITSGLAISHFTRIVAEAAAAGGKPRRARTFQGTGSRDATALLRETLARQPDGSVVVIQVGFSTNLARLLDSGPDAISPLTGRALVGRKVRLLSAMAGNFAEARDGRAGGSPEFNLLMDVPAAKKLFAGWPTPVVASGFEIGAGMLFPAARVEDGFRYDPGHPVAQAYRSYSLSGTLTIDGVARKLSQAWPHDHATFDLTSVLHAVRPDHGYFSLSKPGNISVRDDGGADFVADAQGRQRYLTISEAQKAQALEAMVGLVSQPPAALGQQARRGNPRRAEAGEQRP